MKSIIILGTARKQSNTGKAATYLSQMIDSDIVDLLDLEIGRYDYSNQNQDDDFLPLMEKISSNYDMLILATPVYWYSVSGIMKDFMDRLTDCLTIAKPIGRNLKSKHLALLSMGSEKALLSSFADPIRETANYLEMQYDGHIHTWCNEEKLADQAKENINSFVSIFEDLK